MVEAVGWFYLTLQLTVIGISKLPFPHAFIPSSPNFSNSKFHGPPFRPPGDRNATVNR